MWLFDFIEDVVDGFCEFIFFSILFFMKIFIFFIIVSVACIVIYDNLVNIFILLGCGCIVIFAGVMCVKIRGTIANMVVRHKLRVAGKDS